MAKTSEESCNSSDTYHDTESSHGLLSGDFVERSRSAASAGRSLRMMVLFPWILCVILSLSLASVMVRSTQDCLTESFWRPFELKAATRELPKVYHNVQFDASLHYNESHLLYRPLTDPPYVGDPSPEIDQAWDDLIGSVDVFVTPEEQKEFGQDLWLDPATGLHVGLLSVMHDLHCVNMIRMSLNPEYYPKMKHYTTKIHIEHCLDTLRLSLMCTGDMTLIPTKSSDVRPFEAIFETVHACRDFSAAKEWSIERDAKTPGKFEENARKLKEKMGIKSH